MKFIIRAAAGPVPAAVREALAASPGIALLDETPRMLLVEADAESSLRAAADLSGLLVVPERHYDPPKAN